MSTRYQDNQELRGQLAAEYALGTLRGRARARFEKLLRGDVTLRGEVTFWQERFSEFATRLKPVAPRAVVWAALQQTIEADAARKVVRIPTRAAQPAKQSRRPLIWQTWAAAATVAAVAMGFGLLREQARTETLVAALDAAQNKPMPYLAVLQPAGGDARWAISVHTEEQVIRVVLSGSKMPADTKKRSLELWMLDSKGKPHSLGLLPVSGSKAVDLPLPKMPPEELGVTLTLAISEEPRGGSPTGLPTGKVLGAVPAVRPI
ncbi:MAG: anti-sigma factor [Pseudomonadota bacterium]